LSPEYLQSWWWFPLLQWTRPLPWPPASPLPLLLLPPLPLPLPLPLLPFTESTCSLWTRGLVALFLELPFPLDPGRTAPGTAWWEWAWLPPWWEWELEWPWEWPWPSFFAAFALSSTGGLEPFVAAVVAEGKEVLLLLLLLLAVASESSVVKAVADDDVFWGSDNAVAAAAAAAAAAFSVRCCGFTVTSGARTTGSL
jgi:hypothetical protein